jgi:hypothetical protein
MGKARRKYDEKETGAVSLDFAAFPDEAITLDLGPTAKT